MSSFRTSSSASGATVSAKLHLPDPDGFRAVRIVRLSNDPPSVEARSRSTGVPALYRRADRDQHADPSPFAADRKHGTGAGAWLRDAAGLFHLHHSLLLAARFLAVHPP